MSELRIVKGNDFTTLYKITATYADGTEVEDFDLRSCTDVQVLAHKKTGTGYASIKKDISSFGSYTLEEDNILRIAWDGLLMKNGTYTVDFIAKFRGADIRSYSIRDLVFDIVETNEEANIPAGAFVDNGTYRFSGEFVLMFESQVQADWEQADDTKPDYIKNKPTIPQSLSELSDDSEHRTVTDTEKSAWNSKSDFSGSYNDLTDKPDIDSMEDSISQIEDELEEKVDKVPLKGLSTNDYTNVEKDKLSALPTNAELSDALSDKVDKVPNKGLSTNDYTTEDKNKLTGLENYDDTTVRQLISDTNANFANYYTKVQTYSQTEVDTMLRTQRQGRFVVADTLPDASEETMFIIYLVPNSNSETQNVKDEFITLQNGNIYSWEQIGSTSIDLSDYPTIQEMNDAIADAIVGFYTKPSSGIPKSDLAPAVQASLNNADTALQSYTETDPTVPSWAKAVNKPSYTASEVGALPADTHIPTSLSELSSDSTHRLVTDTEKATWNGKQDAIGDLETIRSGASLGATAYQKPSEGIPDSDMTVEVQDALNSAVAAYQKPSTGISKSDMASEVQSTLNKADSSVQPSSIAEFITRSVNDLANYYLKSETYTKDEVQALLDAIQGFSYEVVSSLPVASADTMGKIYLIPSSDPQVQNVKDEYITIVSSNVYEWEQIGSTAVSLEGYVTTEELNTALANYWLKSDVVNISLADVAISGSYNDLDDKPTIPYKLADMQEDVTHRVVTDAEKSTWNSKGTYSKPNSGIPASDLATEVKSSLDLANSALQEETDPTVPSWAKAANKPSYTAAEVGALPSDTFIPTKTSELTNDSDFITSADIPVQVELTSEIINSLWEAAV